MARSNQPVVQAPIHVVPAVLYVGVMYVYTCQSSSPSRVANRILPSPSIEAPAPPAHIVGGIAAAPVVGPQAAAIQPGLFPGFQLQAPLLNSLYGHTRPGPLSEN
jgi:hypothetical protein